MICPSNCRSALVSRYTWDKKERTGRSYLFLPAFALKYTPDNGVWDVQVYVRNMFNEVVFANATRNFNAGPNNYQFQAPRTFGARGSVRF